MTYMRHDMDDSYNGILLPPTCEIIYVNMQHDFVNMRLILFQHATVNINTPFWKTLSISINSSSNTDIHVKRIV